MEEWTGGAYLVEVGEDLVEAFGAQAVGQAPGAAGHLDRAGRRLALHLKARAQRRLAPLILRPGNTVRTSPQAILPLTLVWSGYQYVLSIHHAASFVCTEDAGISEGHSQGICQWCMSARSLRSPFAVEVVADWQALEVAAAEVGTLVDGWCEEWAPSGVVDRVIGRRLRRALSRLRNLSPLVQPASHITPDHPYDSCPLTLVI